MITIGLPNRPISSVAVPEATTITSQAWMQSRYEKGETEEERTAYLNCPMDRQQYEEFVDALLASGHQD